MSGGNLSLSNTGTNANHGTIDVPAGLQLRLTGALLSNRGSLGLNGGTVTGAGSLNNATAGVITGRGTISAPLGTNRGTILGTGGTLNITQAFSNAGIIRLTSNGNLGGGAITNTGRIQGEGSIGNAISNTGRIEPSGMLTLGGTVTNTGAGIITAMDRSLISFLEGLAVNAATISLQGGSLDNNRLPMNNTGQISGFGTIYTGGLTNSGSITLTGGFSVVHGPVTNSAGRKIGIVNDPALFTGFFTNNGSLEVINTTATFAGGSSGAEAAGDSFLGGSGDILVDRTAVLVADAIRQRQVTVNGVVLLQPDADASRVESLHVAGGSQPTGTLDVANNDLVVQATAQNRLTLLATITSQIAAGRNGGVRPWTGKGITSSTAADSALTGLGVLLNDRGGAEAGQPIYTEFGGIPVDANSILVGHAWLGDLDLNGTVDGDDYYRLDRGFLTGATGYASGDLDYSGDIGPKDYFWLSAKVAGITAKATTGGSWRGSC